METSQHPEIERIAAWNKRNFESLKLAVQRLEKADELDNCEKAIQYFEQGREILSLLNGQALSEETRAFLLVQLQECRYVNHRWLTQRVDPYFTELVSVLAGQDARTRRQAVAVLMKKCSEMPPPRADVGDLETIIAPMICKFPAEADPIVSTLVKDEKQTHRFHRIRLLAEIAAGNDGLRNEIGATILNELRQCINKQQQVLALEYLQSLVRSKWSSPASTALVQEAIERFPAVEEEHQRFQLAACEYLLQSGDENLARQKLTTLAESPDTVGNIRQQILQLMRKKNVRIDAQLAEMVLEKAKYSDLVKLDSQAYSLSLGELDPYYTASLLPTLRSLAADPTVFMQNTARQMLLKMQAN